MKDEKKYTDEEKIVEENEARLEEGNQEKDPNRVEIDPEVLEKIVTELEEKYNLKKENIKIVKVHKEPASKSILKVILSSLLLWVFDFLLIVALNGYLEFAPNDIIHLLIYSIVFYIIELSGRVIIDKYYKKFILYSFGTIMLPVTIVALLLAHLATGLEFLNNSDMIAFFILFIIIRVIIRFLMMRKEIMKAMRGRKNEKH